MRWWKTVSLTEGRFAIIVLKKELESLSPPSAVSSNWQQIDIRV